MPHNTRAVYKRELERAVNLLGWVYEHVWRIYEAYNDLHPEIGQPAYMICQALLEMAEAIEGINEQI